MKRPIAPTTSRGGGSAVCGGGGGETITAGGSAGGGVAFCDSAGAASTNAAPISAGAERPRKCIAAIMAVRGRSCASRVAEMRRLEEAVYDQEAAHQRCGADG